VLADRVGISLELLELLHERRVHQQRRRLRVGRDLLHYVGRAEDVTELAHPARRVALSLALGVRQAVGEHRERGIDLQTLLVRRDRLVELALAVQRRALAPEALRRVASGVSLQGYAKQARAAACGEGRGVRRTLGQVGAFSMQLSASLRASPHLPSPP
jgi:hypothetical protein